MLGVVLIALPRHFFCTYFECDLTL
jgi:hypothetical protein